MDRAAYTRAGLPWFEHYDHGADDLSPAGPPKPVRPVGEWLGAGLKPRQQPAPGQVVPLKEAPGRPAADGD
ncbi:hypothetical protein [Streptomyces griseoluteus]|uniref:hypothetical protein n=1 Tax=Streptomyces griseoluteus TaxID=29306 RepID=UPI0036C548F5